jgi:hypothetical protein
MAARMKAVGGALSFRVITVALDGGARRWPLSSRREEATPAKVLRPVVLTAVLIGFVVGANLGVAADDEAARPRIAWQTDRAGEGTWLIHPDGTDDHQMSADFPGNLILPDWSPDGQRLVMTSRVTGGAKPV